MGLRLNVLIKLMKSRKSFSVTTYSSSVWTTFWITVYSERSNVGLTYFLLCRTYVCPLGAGRHLVWAVGRTLDEKIFFLKKQSFVYIFVYLPYVHSFIKMQHTKRCLSSFILHQYILLDIHVKGSTESVNHHLNVEERGGSWNDSMGT